MKIAIIGAGFTGLAAGLKLVSAGHQVTIFEANSVPGGLAAGFKDPKWQWTLDKYYHHCFTNDKSILNLAKEVEYPFIIKRPKTTVYVNDKFYKLDSPIDVLRFPELNIAQRLRMGFVLALLKYNPFWKPLEKFKASDVLPKMMGEKPYRLLWEPLIIKKFGPYANNISLAWFWSRIAKRTPSLAYPQGGFLEFANTIARAIGKKGGRILFNKKIVNINHQKDGSIKIDDKFFDKLIVTTSGELFTQIAPQLPDNYKQKLLDLTYLSTINLILRLKKPFFNDSTYWLNVCQAKDPITAIVEHTNFVDKKYYNNKYLLYLGNYLTKDHPFMKMTKEEVLRAYDPMLKKINKEYALEIIDSYLFKDLFAQPIVPVNYSKIVPPFKTPLKNVYLANMQQVYPWDRGTNYAVELGEKIADIIFES